MIDSFEQPSVDCRLVSTREERTWSFRLVYRNYLESNLIEPNRFGLHVTPYHLLATSHTFIAVASGSATPNSCRGDDVICTLSLITDGRLGLPMECSYQNEVAQMRSDGKRLAEVSFLAFNHRKQNHFLRVFLQINGLMAQFSRANGIDRLLIASHPRHSNFYERWMGFARFGELKPYRLVCDRPAVASYVDFDQLDQDPPRCYRSIFGAPIPASRLSAQPITVEDCLHFHAAAQSISNKVDDPNSLRIDSSDPSRTGIVPHFGTFPNLTESLLHDRNH